MVGTFVWNLNPDVGVNVTDSIVETILFVGVGEGRDEDGEVDGNIAGCA